MHWLALCVLLTAVLALVALAREGVREGIPRVVGVSLLLAALLAGLAVSLHVWRERPGARAAEWVVVAAAAALAAAVVARWGRLPEPPDTSRARRFDERDHMFARANLAHHPELALRQWERRPQQREVDERLFRMPPLGGPGSRYHDPDVAPVAEAAFSILDRMYAPLARRPAGAGTGGDPERILATLRYLALRYGAVDLGVARTRPYHWYSHAGRQAHRWGEPIEPRHSTALVIVVAMDFAAIQRAPTLPVLLESSRQYVESAKIAHLVAEYLALRGYDATAHVDGNYEVICAPLAQEAGLGHVGRMGIFMHHRFGPCVRLSVVTTDLELPPTRGDHRFMEAFCEICKKCARACPSRSIPEGGPPVSRGFPHWSVGQESCYAFWRKIGTDCAVCIRSCPFTKPDTALHRVVRWAIRRNPLNRRLALWADDLFYGRRPRLASANPTFEELTRAS